MAGVAAMGITVVYAGATLTATSFSVNDTVDNADGSHLGIAVNGRREYVPTFVQREITVDFIATSNITTQTGAISVTGAGVAYSGNATLQSSSVSGAVGDLVKGNATFRVA